MRDAAEIPEITVDELAQLRRAGGVCVLDVREAWELDNCALPDSLHVPLGELPAHLGELPRDRMLVVLCHHGVRSAHAVAWLRSQGLANAVNLGGGIDAWAQAIEPAMRTY
jgi:rhodanese-related sulfurtransferase